MADRSSLLLACLASLLAACPAKSTPAPPDAAGEALLYTPGPTAKEAFTDRFVAYVHEKNPEAPIHPSGELGIQLGESPVFHLEELWNECQATPATCDAAMAHWQDLIAPAPKKPTLSAESLRIALFPSEAAQRQQLVRRPFVETLDQALAIESTSTLEPIKREDLKTLGLSEDAAWKRALANLHALPEGMSSEALAEESTNVRVSEFHDGYGAGRLLLPERWAATAGGGKLLVSTPSQSRIIWARDPDARAGLALRWLSQQMMLHEAVPLSAAVLRWTPKGFVLEDKNEAPADPATGP